MMIHSKTHGIHGSASPLLYSWCWTRAVIRALRQRALMIWVFHIAGPLSQHKHGQKNTQTNNTQPRKGN